MDRHSTNTKISPTQVITIYNDHGKSKYYLEHRHVKNVAGKLTLLAPTPLGEEVFRNIAGAFIKNRVSNLKFEGLIPGHILYGYNELGKTAVIWYRPSGKRLLNFSASAFKAEGTGMSVTVEIPATLYVLVDKALYVFGLMNNERPGMETKVYRAPFFNIYEDGRVCLGTARVGKKTATFEGEADRYERAFYMAEQNGGINNHCKTPINQLWPKLIKSKAPFPSREELLQHNRYKTLSGVITTLIGRK